MTTQVIGVIGGSGLYEIDGLKNIEEVKLSTPFGEPSDAYICGELDGVRMGSYRATAAATASARPRSTSARTSGA